MSASRLAPSGEHILRRNKTCLLIRACATKSYKVAERLRNEEVFALAYSPWADTVLIDVVRALACITRNESLAIAKNGFFYKHKSDNLDGSYISGEKPVSFASRLLVNALYKSDGLECSAIVYRLRQEGIDIGLYRFTCGPRFVITLF
jgi:hypothetical protein